MSRPESSLGKPSMLTVQLMSSSGPRFGLSEIELLDNAGSVLCIPAAWVSAKNSKNQSGDPSVLFNREPQTTEAENMWSVERESPERPVEVCIDTSKLQATVTGMRIWNWSKSDDSGTDPVTEVRVYDAGSTPLFNDVIQAQGSTLIPFTKDNKGCCGCACYNKMKRGIAGVFWRYGKFVGRHPLPFIVISILIYGGLGLGLLALDTETDMETIYFPKDSRALKDRQNVRDNFPNMNNASYNAFSQSDPDEAISLLFKSKGNDILENNTLMEIENIINITKSVVASSSGLTLTFTDVCARSVSQCVVDGEYVLDTPFRTALVAKGVVYPYWNTGAGTIALFTAISGVNTQQGGVLVSATVLKISFKLTAGSEAWQREVLTLVSNLNPVYTEITYETPDSLSEELDKSTKGDIWAFSLTITIMLTYASVVTTGGNPVSTRALLATAGVLAAGLGIVGSMGLLSLCDVKFVNIVGVIPFLVIGVGVDDMFLLMSSWSETLELTQLTVPARVGETFSRAGIGITITSMTDFLAFVIGTTSVFRSVTNFSLYAGVAVLFCYICNATLFGGCLAYHGRRVYASRHFFTCLKTKPRDVLKAEGRSACFSLCCGGSVPKTDRADESIFEKLPRSFLPNIVLNTFVRIVILFGFLGYLAAAIYGTIHLNQGLVLKDLVLKSSYYHRFLELNDEYFPTRLPVGFIIVEEIDYSGSHGIQLQQLLQNAQQDSMIDSSFERCWLSHYQNSTFFNSSSSQNFVTNLQSFLATSEEFKPDVIFDSSKTKIIASRCFLWSKPIREQYAQADLMVRMRDLADSSPLPVFAYHSAFVAFEQFLAVLPATLQMVGCAVAVMFVVTFIFLPHLLMVMLVTLTIVMILLGIFGFMYFWGISLSSVTMIHLVMSVGFSVDFSAHVCAAYLVSNADTRLARARDAVTHAASPILNGAVSTLLGVILLVLSDSYIFTSFFQIMILVIVFGMLHAVLFLPVVLSIIGPEVHSTQKCHVSLNRKIPRPNIRPS